jgi:hypothetical protein
LSLTVLQCLKYERDDPFANDAYYSQFFDNYGLFLVFDLGSNSSFQKVEKFWAEVQKRQLRKNAICTLVGVQSGSMKTKDVSSQDIERFSEEHSLTYFEVNFDASEGVADCIQTALANLPLLDKTPVRVKSARN